MKKKITIKEKRFSFFADPQERKAVSRHTIGTLPFARHTSLRFAKVKEPNCANANNNQMNYNPLNLMHMKKILILISLAILTNIKDASSQDMRIVNQDSINTIVIHTVESSMNLFFDSIPDRFLINYGINDRNEISRITIGKPIGVYNIVNDNLFFTSSWRVPIIINNEYRALFTVIRNDTGGYKIFDFGATLLAKEIFNESKYNDMKGLLRVFELRKDFFICDNNKGEFEFKPIPTLDKQQYKLIDILKIIK